MKANDIQPKSIKRIGSHNTTKTRPLKITFINKENKEQIMKSLWKLKGKKMFKGITVTNDYKLTERAMIKEFVIKAKTKNSLEPDNTNYIWRVCGDPKNGLVIKRFNKIDCKIKN